MKKVELPSTLACLGTGEGAVFSNCTSLEKITIPSRVTEMGESTFYNCKSLSDVTGSSGVINIKERTFAGCASLEHITIPYGVKVIEADAFSDSGLKTVDLPSGIREIGNEAFRGCGLESIVLPDSVQYIGYKAFGDCTKLSRMDMLSHEYGIDHDILQGSANVTLYGAYGSSTESIARSDQIPFVGYVTSERSHTNHPMEMWIPFLLLARLRQTKQVQQK